MKKGAGSKKVNRIIKKLNRSLERDVFGDRFWVRQVQKAKADGIEYFRFELIDREDPTRNHEIRSWFNEFEVEWKVFQEINDFIVRSNFWAKWFNDESRYDKEQDFYKNC